MTDGIHHSNDAEGGSDACQHAIDVLHDTGLSRAHTLLAEARAAVECARYAESEQSHRETTSG